MRKYIATILILLFSCLAFAQTPKEVKLISSELSKGFTSKGLIRIIRPVFSHEGSTLAADSANFDQKRNTFDAFGNIVITQPNGTTVYSDLLNYNGNNKVAILTRNVRLIDGDATLTTDRLTYNMATKIGTYIGGGKIVNGQNVLTSKRGYYFANTRDAYFRNNVVLTTPDALIKSDTLRYNTTSKIAYFYGPTNIYGKDDTLYTENGTYNTVNDQARFGKNNLYTQGSKSLKGDSLFYDRKAGYGRALGNITFVDAAEKITFKGDIGLYNKAEESILATKNAYVIITTESDSAKVDSIYMTADTLFSKMVLDSKIKPYRKQELRKDTDLEEVVATDAEAGADGNAEPKPLKPGRKERNEAKNKKADAGKIPVKPDEKVPPLDSLAAKKPGDKRDSISADSIAKLKTEIKQPDSTQIVNPKSEMVAVDTVVAEVAKKAIVKDKPVVVKQSRKERRAAKNQKKDASRSSAKPDENLAKPADSIAAKKPELALADSLTKSEKAAGKKDFDPQAAPKLAKRADSLIVDTAKTRIVMAYHKAKVFKSDLQARADSLFFSYGDSTLRFYVNPMIWTQGSQLSADTVYLQLKNKKLDNMLLQHNAFIVNTDEGDSTHFNQVKGKVITGLFTDGKLNRMYVDGNAESIYYVKEDSTYTGLNRMLSSRIKVLFKDSKLKDIISILKPEGNYYPIDEIPKDEEILKGFIWKPKDRPRSKEEIIPSLGRKQQPKPAVKTPAKKPVKKPAKVVTKSN